MPQTIKLKRSATPGQVPTVSQLDLGEVAINTSDGKLFIRKSVGATNVIMEIAGSIAGTAIQTTSSATAPTTPAGGDLWFDTVNDSLLVWNGTAWEAISGDLVQSTSTTSATAPATRADGSTLVAGDTYYNTNDDTIYTWDGTQWVAMAGDEVQSKLTASATEPTARTDGTALQTGDTFWNTADSEMAIYNGSQWVSLTSTISIPHLGSSATVVTERPNGDPLAVGDIYWNTADSEMKVYTGVAGNLWSPLGGASGGTSITPSDTAPASPAIGDGWVDTLTTGQLFIWDGNFWLAAVGGANGVFDSDNFLGIYNNLVADGNISGVFDSDNLVDLSQVQVENNTSTVFGQVSGQRLAQAAAVNVPDVLNASGSAPVYACRAWVNFNGTGTVAIRASGNVSSITDNGTGDFTVNFTTAMEDASYVVSGTCSRQDGGPNDGNNLFGISRTATPLTVNGCRVNAVGNSSALIDMPTVTVAIFR